MVSARLLMVAVVLGIGTLVIHAMSYAALASIRQAAPLADDRINRLELLQHVWAAGSVLASGLLIWALRRMIRREQDAAREPRLRAILNTSSDAIVTIDEQSIMLDVNRMAEQLFGYRADELLGKNVSMLAASPYREEHDGYVERYLRTNEAHIIGRERPVVGQHKNGTQFPVALRVSEMHDEGKRIFIGILHDLRAETERTKLIESTRDTVSQLAAATVELLAATAEQAASAEEQVASLTETVATANQVAQTAEQAAQRARAVAELSRRVDELGKAGRKSVEESVSATDVVREQSESIAENIVELADQAQTIGEIIATVNTIAEQTHLLALNAAIEASRAGEHGRGFSVVAAEVRALAEQSKKATLQVRSILGQIQKATNNAVISAENGSKSIHSTVTATTRAGETITTLSDLLGQASDSAAQIAASAGQQATGTLQINQAMKTIEQAVRQNLKSIKQVEQAASDLNALSERLKELLSSYGR
jgi:PAS domain S-box-containing protein